MRLVWAKYNGSTTKYALLVIIGQEGNKIYAIESNKFSTQEAKILKIKNDFVMQLNLPYRIDWCKKNLPSAGQNIHTYLQERLHIIKEMPLN